MSVIRVLVVEDEEAIAQGIIYNFERAGYSVFHIKDGAKALALVLEQNFDLVVLDVMLPHKTGFEILETMRTKRNFTPVLMLTALSDTKERVRGIRLGADDYLGKPFDVEELLARAEALLRRSTWSDTSEPHVKATLSPISLGTIIFDRAAHILRAVPEDKSKSIPLTAMESKLLAALLDQATSSTAPERFIPRTELLSNIWGFQEGTQTRTLDMFIARLRHYFVELGETNTKIEVLRGVGYRLALGPVS
ncbi:MAG TPA: response regulator transcription factor [Oligoflexia bacterium]|mgnify:CR=1 FL=1|nr:response regulator transcription factor [Oligoflexia bacterium]